MRIVHPLFIPAFVLLLGPSDLMVSAQAKYGVTVKEANAAALAKAKTYAWMVGQPALDRGVDKMIIAAVDRELGARGLAKVERGKHDVELTYASVHRTDVDLKSKSQKDGATPETLVGTLVVRVLKPANLEVLFNTRMDTPIGHDRVTLEATIGEAVEAMFAKYPVKPTR